MNNAQKILLQGKQILKESGIETFSFDAACLFAHFCGISASQIPITDKIPENTEDFINSCIRRANGYPLQYIIGSWEFYGLEFAVNPSVLIPRADTETLIDYVLENYSGKLSVLDMCCGSGCIGLTLKKHLPDAEVILCDISEQALSVTAQNAKSLGLDVKISKADLLKGSSKYFENESFDIIISNPPYITEKDMQTLSCEVKHEPYIALYGGEDGMDFYRALICDWKKALKPHGEIILETGYDTADGVRTLLTELEYSEIISKRDLNGIVRLVAAKKEGK